MKQIKATQIFASLLLFTLTFVLSPNWAYAASKLQVQINRNAPAYDISPKIKNGQPLIPLRKTLEMFHFTLDWNEDVKTATARRGNTIISVKPGTSSVLLNGKSIPLTADAEITEGKLLVAADLFSKVLDIQSLWNGETGLLNIQTLTDDKGEYQPFRPVLLFGDSLTFGLATMGNFDGYWVINQGVSGNTTAQMLKRIRKALEQKPRKFFIMAGVNDLYGLKKPSSILSNYEIILEEVAAAVPDCKVYIQSTLPFGRSAMSTNPYISNIRVEELDYQLAGLAKAEGAAYLDISTLFRTREGDLNPAYSIDGIHLTPDGYVRWANYIKAYLD